MAWAAGCSHPQEGAGCHPLEVLVPVVGCVERGRCIGLHHLAGDQVFIQKYGHAFTANAVHCLHGKKAGLLAPGLDGHQHRTLAENPRRRPFR